MAPVVAQIEHVAEQGAGLDRTGHLERGVIEPAGVGIDVSEPDPSSVSELEHVQVRQVPPRKGAVDGSRESSERVTGSDEKDPAGRRLAVDVAATLQLDFDLKPSASHRGRQGSWARVTYRFFIIVSLAGCLAPER